MRDHTPLELKGFKGLWSRDDAYTNPFSCPQDHLLEANNLDYSNRGIEIRKLFAKLDEFGFADARRVFFYTVLERTYALIGLKNGDLYSYRMDTGATGLLYAAPDNSDYDFIVINQRCYIAPSDDGYYGGGTGSIPLQLFDVNGFRQAGGSKPATSATVANSGSAGVVQAGTRFFGICYETNTGFITPPKETSPTSLDCPGDEKVSFSSIPTGGSEVVARHIVCTKAIKNPIPNGTINDYQIFFLHRIDDNSTTTYDADFYDSQLLSDATYLLDTYEAIPGGSSITVYNGRIVITAPESANNNRLLVSRFNDVETFDQVNGIIDIVENNTKDSQGIYEAQVYKNVLYAFRPHSTYAVTDNNLEPAFWPVNLIDSTLGSFRHGVAVSSSNTAESVEYLIIANFSGIFLFIGYFVRPELTYKVANRYATIVSALEDRGQRITVLNDLSNKRLYFFTLDDDQEYYFLMGNYADIDNDITSYQSLIKWSNWEFYTDASNYCFPGALGLYADKEVKLFAVDIENAYDIFEYDGSAVERENQVIGSFRTFNARLSDLRMVHCAGVRFLGNSTGGTCITSLIELKGRSDSHSQTLPNLNIANNSQIDPTLLCNFLSQSISLRMVFTVASAGNLNLQSIILFLKELYKTLPYQYNAD